MAIISPRENVYGGGGGGACASMMRRKMSCRLRQSKGVEPVALAAHQPCTSDIEVQIYSNITITDNELVTCFYFYELKF